MRIIIFCFIISVLFGSDSDLEFNNNKFFTSYDTVNADKILSENKFIEKIFYKNNIGFYRIKNSDYFIYTYDNSTCPDINPYFKTTSSLGFAQASISEECLFLIEQHKANKHYELIKNLSLGLKDSDKFYNICKRLIRLYVFLRENSIDLYYVGTNENEKELIKEILN